MGGEAEGAGSGTCDVGASGLSVAGAGWVEILAVKVTALTRHGASCLDSVT